MKNIENLNERVENAVQKFHDSENLRRRENKSLSRILNDLEIKFEARSAELDDCQSRIRDLEESNVSLNALVCQLVDLVEKSADEISSDPLYRASAAASEIVDRYVADHAGDKDAGPAVVHRLTPATAPEQGPPTATATESLAAGRFEDMGEEYLLAEDLYEKTEGAYEFPRLVFEAVAAARGEMLPEAVNDLAPASEKAEEAPLNEGDLDIREIMARLEIAAERAQLRADEDARRDRGEAAPEILDRAVGGRA
jgi:hypothetical protein